MTKLLWLLIPILAGIVLSFFYLGGVGRLTFREGFLGWLMAAISTILFALANQ